jgi:transcriptional regulator with XRE-family HTH domain
MKSAHTITAINPRPSKETMDTKEKFKLARKYQRPPLTQEGVADLLKVTREAVAKWESPASPNKPPASILGRVARYWNIPESWFYDGGDTPPPFPDSGLAAGNAVLAEASSREMAGRLSATEALITVWRGVVCGPADECVFLEPDSPEFRAVSIAYIHGDPDNYVLCVASGASMYPRIAQGEETIIRRELNPSAGDIVLVRHPDGQMFLKVLRLARNGRPELHSVNPDFPPITAVEGWQYIGIAVYIRHAYRPGEANIEFDDGRPLRG